MKLNTKIITIYILKSLLNKCVIEIKIKKIEKNLKKI